MAKPRISVCITHYNRPESLGATLDSLARQTRQPDEIFLWDDCSPKDPTPVVEQWKDRLPNFTYYRNATNLGMPGNLNAVVSQATGDYVANLHDADIYHPELLEKWVAALDAYPEAGLVFCRDSRWDNPRFVRDWTPEPPEVMDGREFFKQFYVGRIDSLIWGTVMVRRSLYDELLPFDPQYRNWADVDMWMRICGRAPIAFVPEKLLELDANPTHGGGFSFEQKRLVQGMVLTNVERVVRKSDYLAIRKIQIDIWKRLKVRWICGRLRRGELISLFKELRGPHV